MTETFKPHRRAWEVDPVALRAATKLLDIHEPVEVTYTAQLRTDGKHGYRNGKHIVRLSTYLTAEGASRTLWHELAHASQQERFSDRQSYAAAYLSEQAVRGYRANVFEIEARTASDFAEDHPLTQRVGAVKLKSDPPRWYEEERA